MRPRLASSFIMVLSISLIPFAAHAQWQLDGVPVSTAANNQQNPTVVSDGLGGAIVTWQDARSGTADIYAQRVNASGVAQWTASGVALCTAAFDQYTPTIVSDGSGGAIVTWYDYRSGTNNDIYAQRVNALGVAQWTANGVALCTAANDQYIPTIVSDGSGGAIVTWYDLRSGTNFDIYAQRVNALGVAQWTANGVALSTAAFDQSSPTIVSDGSGGAIITWQDARSGLFDIYAQRVNASGVAQWTANGVALCTAAGDQFYPTIVSDGSGGAIVTWQGDIYAQRVNALGVTQWTANGVALCTAANDQYSPTIVSDGSGGAIVTWYDYRSGPADIYVQRVNASGVAQWTANGVALCTAANDQWSPTIVSDGSGGAIITWQDYRSGPTDIYAQRFNALGVAQWTANGAALSTAANDQLSPTIVSDGLGGAIVTWQDARSGTADIYAQRVEADFGAWGQPEPLVTSVGDVRADQGGKVAVNWKRSGHDALPLQEISHYSIWRAVDVVALASSSDALVAGRAWVDPSSIGPDFQGTAIAHERIASTDYYWEWIANQNSTHDAGYSFAASTREDSVSGNPATHYFRVIAHTSNPYVLYKSNVMSGHSVDNLAPAAPLQLMAQRVGSDVSLKWNRVRVPDLRDYSVYRKTSTGVTPVPINFLSSAEDTVLVDAGAPTSALYYIVTATDVHENQSAPSNEAGVSATTGVGNTPSITALTVLQNHPNPFTGATELSIGLPASSDVKIEVYDVAGRRVRAVEMKMAGAGWQKVPFDGRDGAGRLLTSGVYFYRVSASGTTVTRKMVITR
jgi:hypothetical protein